MAERDGTALDKLRELHTRAVHQSGYVPDGCAPQSWSLDAWALITSVEFSQWLDDVDLTPAPHELRPVTDAERVRLRDALDRAPSIIQVDDDTHVLQGKLTRMTVYALQLEAERDALRTAVKRIDALWHAAGSGPVSAAALRIILTDLACEHMERS